MVIIVWPLLVLVVGLFVYFAIEKPQWKEVGRIMFFVGLLWTVYLLTGHQFALGGR